MKRRRKVFYYVQNWDNPEDRTFWWNRKDWREPVEPIEPPEADKRYIAFNIDGEVKRVGRGGASSMKKCRTMRAAMRCGRRLQQLGGTPLISRSVIFSRDGVKRRKWIDYTLRAG